MLIFDNHNIGEILNFVSVFWIVWYTPFVAYRIVKGGFYNFGRYQHTH